MLYFQLQNLKCVWIKLFIKIEHIVTKKGSLLIRFFKREPFLSNILVGKLNVTKKYMYRIRYK